MSYRDDEEGTWGEEVAWDDITADYPELRDDAEFRDYWDDMFQDSMNFDDAHYAYDDLNNHLRDHYGINIDDYFNWNDWRIEHMDS